MLPHGETELGILEYSCCIAFGSHDRNNLTKGHLPQASALACATIYARLADYSSLHHWDKS